MEHHYPSRLLEKAVGEFAKLPGVGRKTALRLVLHLLRQDVESVNAFAGSISKMRNEVKHCSKCHNISDTDIRPELTDDALDCRVVRHVEPSVIAF